MLTNHCCSELKSQNAFVPEPEAGIKFRDASDNWTVGPVPSPAVCQLDDVEAILASKQAKTTYKMTLRNSDGDVCVVTLTPGQDDGSKIVKLDGKSNTNLRDVSTDQPNCRPDATGNNEISVCYSTTTGTLNITTPITGDGPLTCEFSEIEPDEDQPTVIDTRYLHKKEIVLTLAGTSVANHSSDNYRIMKDEFNCEVQGTIFKSADITCGDEEDAVSGGLQLQAKCMNMLKDHSDGDDSKSKTAKCKFEMEMNLLDISFLIQRSNINYHDCAPGSQLNTKDGVCELCEKGKYRGKLTDSNCSGCHERQYAPNIGSTECFLCVNGYVDNTAHTCTPCAPGQIVEGNNCVHCEAGKYQNETYNCEPCEDFKYSLAGSTECFTCKPGYEVTDHKDGCTACPPGWYKDDPKTSKCRECGGGEFTTILHGQSKCDVAIKSEVFCKLGEFSSDAVGRLTFPPVQAGQESEAKCPYNEDSSAKRLCNADGQWEEPDITACDSQKTAIIEEITVKSESTIRELGDETQKVEKVAPKDIEAVVSKMTGSEVQNVFNSSTESSIESLAITSMGVVSNMMAASKSSPTDQRIKNDIVDCFENIALLALEHMKAADANVNITTDSTDVYLVKDAAAAESIGNSDIQINIHESSNIKNLAALIYKDNSAFKPPNATRGSTYIAGKVVGLKHTKRTGDSTDNNISFKMKFDFQDLKNPEKIPRQKVSKRCKYYETETNTWSTRGCTTTEAEDGSVECECDHMTSFAVILSVQESKVPMWLSNLVLGINVTFCLLTLLCTLPFRTFRVRKMTIIQSHSILSLCLLCVTWFLMQDLELSDSKPAYESAECKAVAFIAHYFLMATFSWIFCCSLTLKSQIVDAVKSFGKKNKNLVKKCVLFGYGFPLLIPSLAFLMDCLMKKYSTPGSEIHYIRKLECWYEDIWVYSFILFPIYVFFIINIVCFIKIMRVIGNARRSSDGGSDRRVVKAGFALAFTQGLPWIMHPGVLTDGAAEVFQYLFLITFGFQGIGLFVFNVLFQEEVLKNLCGLLNVNPPLIFLSVVPSKQRRTPNSQTGETSLGTARNSTGNNDKCYSNNLTLNSVATAAVGEKSLYQDSSHYNELHESSLVTEHRTEDTYSHLNAIKTRELGGSNPELLGPPVVSPRVVTFVAGTRAYGVPEGHRSPIPGETEALEHQGPPLM